MERDSDTKRSPGKSSGKPERSLLPAKPGKQKSHEERNPAEDKLRESEDKFRSIFEEAMDGIMIADVETSMQIEANKAMCSMLGYTRDEIVRLKMDDVHPKEHLPAIRALFERQTRGEISLAPEVPMLRKDGSVFYADINAIPVTLGGNKCMVGIFRDITERRRSDAALRERERQLAESQRIAHIGSWEHNLETGKVVWSDELFRILGLDPRKDPADFKVFFDNIHAEDRAALKNAIDETVKTGKHFSIDYRYNLTDGSTRILRAQAELIPDHSGKLVILSGTGQDITDQKLAEEKIRKNEEFIRSILDTVDSGIIVIDSNYRIQIANNAYCGQAGLPACDVIGRHCFEVAHKRSRPCYEEGEECSVRGVFATGKPHAALHKHQDRNGQILFVETKAFPIKDTSGSVTSVIETINNITEKHLLEEERLKTQKLESIGTLAGGIAHDFNNLLQGIFGYISMAKWTIDCKEKSLAMLEEAENALNQSVNLTTQLLTFSKGGTPVKKLIDLRPVIENSVRFTLSGSRSGFLVSIPDDLWQAEADKGQLGQVIQNIVLNADQAMPMGGTVIVTAANRAEGDSSLPPTLAKGNYVVITVQDTGVGVPEQYLSKIFDPYFTTKEKGSGLGLATSYSIVKNHGGMIDVRTKSGEGSAFMIYLPAIRGAVRRESAVKPQKLAPLRRARILVMDDEEIIRNLSRELLGVLGHDVEIAKNGEEALEKYKGAMASGHAFDIVILDLTVRGGMGGSETIQKLREIDPAVRAIVSSGYSDDAAIADHLKHGFRAYLKKPSNLNELRSIVHSLL